MFRWRTDGFHLWVCTISAALWLSWTFGVPLDDLFSFVFAFGLFALALLFAGTWAWSLAHGLRREAWLPFAIASGTAALLVAVPWPELYVRANFRLMLSARTEIVRRVQAYDYWENRDHVHVCRTLGGAWGPHPVVFYLSRGFLDHFDAIVFVPEGVPLTAVANGQCVATNPRNIRPYSSQYPGWFRASN